MAAFLFFAFLTLIGGALAVFMGDLSLPDDYDLPEDQLGNSMSDSYHWPGDE